jgi:group I intron endonuclease
MSKSGIYGIFNLENGKVYIGSTVSNQGFNARWGAHRYSLRRNKSKSRYLQNAWNKYGESSFRFSILEECPDEVLVRQEQAWIDCYNSMDHQFGYNLREASNHGKFSEESKKRLSIAIKKLNMKTFLGHHHTKESKRLLSIAHIGKKLTENTKRKIGEKSKLQKNNLGKKFSEEWKRNIGLAQSKPVLQINKVTGEIIAEFRSIADASRNTNINKNSIALVCRGHKTIVKGYLIHNRTAGGFIWRYK